MCWDKCHLTPPNCYPNEANDKVQGTAELEEKRQQDSYRRALSKGYRTINSNRLLHRYRAYSELYRAYGEYIGKDRCIYRCRDKCILIDESIY